MNQFSYSKVECFKKCPYQFGLRYLEKYKTLPNQDADNALILGVSLHYGMETGSVEKAIELYKSHYYCLSDLHIHEIMKLEAMLPKALELFESMGELHHEVEINSDRYKGFVDLVEFNNDGTVNIYDYKYCSEKSVDKYLESGQLHVYRYYLEKVLGYKVKSLYYIIIPKIAIRQKKTEDLVEFRQRLISELEHKEVQLIEVPYEPNKVVDYFNSIVDIFECENFSKNITRLCDWCEYKDYCQKGEDYMLLPQNVRREVKGNLKRRGWVYGPPMSGKTTMLDKAPSVLMLNTDGNIDNVTAPYISVIDQVSMNGRIKNVKLAWDYFKEIVDELEKKQNDFETILVDLAEDAYEHCRIWGCKQLGIDHESANATKAYDYVRSEFLRTMRKLMNLPYENIFLISHEDISKNIFKQNGDNITRIAPAINEKVANKLAGMVGFVGRVVVDKDDKRWLSFKHDNVTFGGGRLKTITVDQIPLDWGELVKIYPITVSEDVTDEDIKDEPAQEGTEKEEVTKDETVEEVQNAPKTDEAASEETINQTVSEESQPAPTRRRRRRTAEEA